MTDPRNTRTGASSPAGWFPPPAGEAAPPVRPTEPARSDNLPADPAESSSAEVHQRQLRTPDMRWPSSPRSGPRFPVAGPVEPVGRPRAPRPAHPAPPVPVGAAASAAPSAPSALSALSALSAPPAPSAPSAPAAARRRSVIRFAEPGPRVAGRPARPASSAGPSPAGPPPGGPSPRPDRRPQATAERPAPRSAWQVAQRVWQEAGVDWQGVPVVTTEPYSPAPDPYAADPYAADAYSPAWLATAAPASSYPDWEELPGLAAGPPPADPWPTGVYPIRPYETEPLPEAPEVPGPGDPGLDQPAAPRRDPHPTKPDLPVVPGLPGPVAPDGPQARAADPAGPPPRPGGWPGPLPPPAFAAPGAFGAPPLSAPVALAAPGAEPDELFRAWQGSVRDASAGRRRWSAGRTGPDAGATDAGDPAGSRRGRAALRIGVPAVVIVAVGAGALLMLTGRANEMLAERANPGPPASGTPAVSASVSPVSTALRGYPGERGTVGVNGIWSASGLTIAAGYADNHPAVWRRARDGKWSLVSAATLGGLPGHLTAVAAGSLGWVAAGSDQVNGTVEPVAYQSADGVTWTPLPVLTSLAGRGAQFLGVAAGPGGYLVVGRTGSGSQTTAAMWWSGDLKSWMNGADTASTGSNATAAVPLGNGFAAVGSANNCHTVWTSSDGKHWASHDLVKPAGAQSATLRAVTAGPGDRIVAGGFAVEDGLDRPIAVTSPDGGEHFTQVVLGLPAGSSTATVTAVTATSDGFVAAGEAGPASAPRPVSWTSKDGLTWSAARPLSGGGTVTALTGTSAASGRAPAIDGTVQRGAAVAVVSVPAG